jgi:hypothetical protein
MDKDNEQLETLSEIKSLMEHSTRYLSLSGLSGLFAGIFALFGVMIACFYLDTSILNNRYYELALSGSKYNVPVLLFILADAICVLGLALGSCMVFTSRNARRKKLPVWSKASELMLINLLVPLVAGGLFCLTLVYNGIFSMVAPVTLIFYGMALFNAGKYTMRDIRYLGICEVAIGLIACILPGYGLLLWALGFGVLHIIYGGAMYYKYER